MKLLLLIAGLSVSTVSYSACLKQNKINYLPVGMISEFCFTDVIKQAKWGDAENFSFELEGFKTIPKMYRNNNISSVVNIIPKKSGLITNLILDTLDEKRIEVTIISVSNKINEKIYN